MINHARTLLLNLPANPATVDDGIGEQLIDPDYRPVELPAALQPVHRTLFPVSADRMLRNYQVTRCLMLLHAVPELSEHLRKYDSRITYDPAKATGFRFTPLHATTLKSSQGGTLYLGPRQPADPWTTGVCLYEYRVTLNDGNVAVHGVRGDTRTVIRPYTLDAGLSEPFVLSCGYQFRLQPATGVDGWLVRVAIPPGPDTLSHAIRDLWSSVTDEVQRTLFRPITPQSDYYASLWRRSREPAYQLGGLLLALIDHLELRRAQG